MTEALSTFDEGKRNQLVVWANKNAQYKMDLLASLQRTNGCSQKGVFYVRDSIYRDPTGPVYHYDFANPAADKNYSKRIILREYDWLTHLSNHVNVITAH